MYASAYYIVGGAKSGEGAIITRSPNATDNIQVIFKPKNLVTFTFLDFK